MRHLRWALLLSVTLAAAVRAEAEGPVLTEEEAADRVLAAHAKGDAAAIKALVEPEVPGPWPIAWRLCHLREFDAALAAAKALKGPFVERLPAYVERRRAAKGEDPATAVFLKAREAGKATRHQEVLELLPPALASSDDVLTARIGLARGRALLALGRPAEVAAAYETGGRAAEAVGWLTCAGWLYIEGGFHAYQQGDRVAAERIWKALLGVAERLQMPRYLALALLNNGSIQHDKGLLDGAHGLAERAVAVARAAPLDDLLPVALDHQGTAARDLGRLPQALALHREAIQRALARDMKVEASLAQSHLAWALADLGEVVPARAAAEAAFALAQDARAGAHAAEALMAMGRIDGDLGLADRALPAFEQAASIYAQVGNARAHGGALLNIASVHVLDERLDAAEPALAKAEEAARKLGDGGLLVGVLTSRAALRYKQGRHEELRRDAEEALASPAVRGEPGAVARLLAFRGTAESLLGRHPEALATLQQAQKEAAAFAQPTLERFVVEALASAHLEAKRYPQALALARTVVERDAVSRILSDEESAGRRGRGGGGAAVGARAAARVGDVAQALWFLESGRSRALLEALGGRRALAPGVLPPALLELETQARAAEARAAARRRVAERAKDADAAKAALAEEQQARVLLTKAIDTIQRQEKAAAALLYPKPRDLAGLRALLGPADALVLLLIEPGGCVAVVVEPSAARVVALGVAAPILAATAPLRLGAAEGQNLAALQPHVEALHRLLVEPLALGASMKRVVIAPDGPLCCTPWSLLLPGREVALVPSGTLWAELRAAAGSVAGEGVLALGDPDHAGIARAARAPFTSSDLGPLPATREEATKVGQTVLLGAEASEPALRKALGTKKRWRAVHLACHGLVDPDRPSRSALALAPGPEDDGLLTALEVTRLRVPADLVALSACETGRGRVVAGEGLVGLTRAFMVAGAPRVLASLWKVDDRATRLLMERFYAHWKPGVPAPRALTLAQKDVREHTEDVVDAEASRTQGRDVRVKRQPYAAPAFWAGWVVWGLPD